MKGAGHMGTPFVHHCVVLNASIKSHEGSSDNRYFVVPMRKVRVRVRVEEDEADFFLHRLIHVFLVHMTICVLLGRFGESRRHDRHRPFSARAKRNGLVAGKPTDDIRVEQSLAKVRSITVPINVSIRTR